MAADVDFDILEEKLSETDSDQELAKSLILYNDDHNTFDFVIESLIEVCNHDLVQAEQCTLIVHNNGKCAVKNGTYTRLNPMRVALCDRGLSAVID